MKRLLYAFASASLLIPAGANAQTLIINEVMQSNIDCIMDDLNNFPDSWVEVMNVSDRTVNLADYAIGKSKKPAKAYRLPEMEIPAGGKVIVYCDKEETGLHTDFRLESGKDCEAYLFLDGEIVDALPEGMKKQPAPNVAYGRVTDGAEEWGYMAVATPGDANCGRLLKKTLSDPVFSAPGRIGTEPLTLSISLPEDAPEGASIHYTLDGKEPTEASDVWTEDLYIEDTKIVRAVLVCDGYITPRSVTHSYIFEPNDTRLQFVSLVSDGDYLYDPEIGIYIVGNDEANPNYQQNWRRPFNIEFFTAKDTDAVINQLGELKVKGGATRSMPLKSLALYANKRFGEKRFSYEFFPELTPGITEFKSVELRNTGNDYQRSMMRDVVIQESFGRNVDIDWAPHQSVIVYLNGKYIGFQNLRPRSDEDFVYSYYDGLEDIDVIENWADVENGDRKNFDAFKDFYSEGTHTLEEYEEWIDVNEFLNYFIMNIFYDNKDWPANNIVQWRALEEGSKWRWIAKDTDMGLGYSAVDWGYSYPTLKWIMRLYQCPVYSKGNSEAGTQLFNNFIADEDCRQAFTDRLAVYMGDFLRADRIIELIDKEAEEIAPEVERLGDLEKQAEKPIWRQSHKAAVNEMKTWATGRCGALYQEMSEVFDMGAPVPTQINTAKVDISDIAVNGIKLSEPLFDGKWFAGSKITLSSDDDYLTGWTVTYVKDGEQETTTIVVDRDWTWPTRLASESTNAVDIEIPECDAVIINPTRYVSVETVAGTSTDFNANLPFEAYTLSGAGIGRFSSVAALRDAAVPGVYILKQGNARVKHILK